MSMFGLSLFDNGLINFFSNFISEIRFIGYNIVDYLSNTNFYNYLSKLFNKSEVIEKIGSKEKYQIKEVKSTEILRNGENIKALPSEYYNKHKTEEPVISRLSE
jgi:hypothetical protein